MTVVNIHLSGELEQDVLTYIKRGYATSKAEVVRMGLIKLLKSEPKFDDISDDPELEQYLLDVKSGKITPIYLKPIKSLDELIK